MIYFFYSRVLIILVTILSKFQCFLRFADKAILWYLYQRALYKYVLAFFYASLGHWKAAKLSRINYTSKKERAIASIIYAEGVQIEFLARINFMIWESIFNE